MLMNLENLKRRLRKVGEGQRGVDVKRMAEVTGLSTKTIRRYLDLSDPTEPSLSFMVAVALEYNLSIDHLIVGGGGSLADTDTDTSWQIYTSWWTANLTQEQKALLMSWAHTIWNTALDKSENNHNLVTEHDAVIERGWDTKEQKKKKPLESPADE